MLNERTLTADELAAREKIIQGMKKNKSKLVKKYGADAEKFMYGRATNIAKQQAEALKQSNDMKDDKLRKMIQDVLSKPLDEKKKPFPDLTGDGKVTKADILKARGVIDEASDNEIILSNEILDFLEERGIIDPSDAQKVHKDLTAFLKSKMVRQGNLEEDLDLGHEDNEPHMIKAELAQIGKYAMELYKMVDQFEGPQEVDFPAWWQGKITTAKNMVSSAKHYLEFELEEPKIDAMVNVASQEGAIDEAMVAALTEKIMKRLKTKI